MAIDIEKARRETPGCHERLHFNNAGAGLLPQPVLDAVIDHLRLESRIGGYEAAAEHAAELEHCYEAIARLLNCRPDEIALVENATRAWDAAFYAIDFKAGDRILTAQAEYASNYIAYLQVARRTGAVIEVVPDDTHGQLDVAALRDMIDERVKLISVTHVPTNGGLVNPAAAIGAVAREAGIPFLLDACQSVGQMPVDVEAIGCDMLSATGRKYLRGPRGTGFLYVRASMLDRLEPPMLDLHAATWVSRDEYRMRADARRFENWEANLAGKIGLGVAVDYAAAWGLDAIEARISGLATLLRRRLAEIDEVEVRDLGQERCGIVTFTVGGTPADDIKRLLADRAINVSVSRRGSTLLDMDRRHLAEVVRASVHYYNTEDEVERLCEALTGIVRS